MYLKFYNSTRMAENINLPSVFLAGPTDRNSEATKWRQEFIKKVAHYKSLEHVVFILPEFCSRNIDSNLKLTTYPDGVISLSDFEPVDLNHIHDSFPKDRIYKWERSNLRKCTKIIFWVDRNLEQDRLALTTNIEFGNFYSSGKCICGSPADADKIDYMKWVWEGECKSKWYFSQDEMIEQLNHQIVNEWFIKV